MVKSENVSIINIISGVVFFVGKRPHLEMQVIWPVKEAALMITTTTLETSLYLSLCTISIKMSPLSSKVLC